MQRKPTASGDDPTARRHDSFMAESWPSVFGKPHDDPEGLHLEYKESNAHYGLTTTQYFGFSVPQHNVHALLYFYFHPNLHTVAAGPMAWQGVKKHAMASELYDYRAYLSDQPLGQFPSFLLDNSYQVDVLNEGRTFRTRYADPARNNSFDVLHTAVSERIYWPSGKHFEQVMRTQGEVVLRGKKYVVDGFNIRDRSWGETRLELPQHSPPVAWATGVFDEKFSFCFAGTDHPDLEPLWKGLYDIASEKVLKFGWVMVDGEPTPIAQLRKRTTYEPATLIPRSVEIEITDARNRKYEIAGTVVAASPLSPFPNCYVPICLSRWECNGRVGWGDIQDAQFTDFAHAHQR